jgi:hypothetical protein
MSSPDIHTRPLAEWFADTANGDIALCDPFSGEPLCGDHIANEPTKPTEAFMKDFKLGNGYGYWRGQTYNDAPPFVGVYLVDPTTPNGLGDYREFRDMAADFDVVVHNDTLSVRMEHVRRQAAGRGVGKVALEDGVETDATFLSALLDSHPRVVDLAPPVDLLTGEPIGVHGRALGAVRDAVIAQGLDQKDPTDPDLTYMATDFVYANTAQWHQVMSAGNVAEGWYPEHGRLLTSMLLLTTPENADLGRKLVVSGLPRKNVDVAFALQEYADDVDTRAYALALDHGYIPHEALRGTEF